MRIRTGRCVAFLAILTFAAQAMAEGPGWWTSRGVVSTNAAVNDYAGANAGQVKWIATNAAAELEATLPGGAGSNVNNVATGFSATNNYLGVNIGQVKALAQPFYDRLIDVGYATSYPWTPATTDDVDYALANIGQVKYAFSFEPARDQDTDGLPDWWQALYGLQPSPEAEGHLVGWWRLEEANGPTVFDSSSFGNDGTAYNMDPWPAVAGYPAGQALDFDPDKTNHIEIVHSASLMPTSAITVAAWVFLNSWGAGGLPVILSKGEPDYSSYVALYGDYSGDLWFDIGTMAIAGKALSTGIWVHVAGVFDGTNAIAYVNAVPGSPAGGASAIPALTNDWTIGAYLDDSSASLCFDGRIADVRIYDSALSPADITNLVQTTWDLDLDGLANSNEYWHGTCPTNSDTDADGLSDSEEVALGTDPANSNSFPVALSGTVSYSGIQTGQIHVVAVTDSNSWSTTHSAVLTAPSAYSISNLPNLTAYWIKAWRDLNGNGSNNYREAFGQYVSNPLNLTSNQAGCDIELADPSADTDSDGLGDWWEMEWFGDLDEVATGDNDDDGAANLQEFQEDTNPLDPESHGSRTLYVSTAGSNAAPFFTWATAAHEIQTAIDAAEPGDIVLVTNGTYSTGGVLLDGITNRIAVTNAITVQSVNGADVTIVEGEGNVRCASLDSAAVLSGFTLTGGLLYSYESCGGGVMGGTVNDCVLTLNCAEMGGGAYDAVLNGCTLVSNNAGYGGGALSGTLTDCTIGWNEADYVGGGVSDADLSGCTVVSNTASDGGGVAASTLVGCMLLGNHAAAQGGGAYVSTLVSCLLVSNAAAQGGGAYEAVLGSCTVVSNMAQYGGGVMLTGASALNSIIYFNAASIEGSNWFPTNSALPATYCCTYPLPDGEGNTTNLPGFVDAAAGNYRLLPWSRCIDAGSTLDVGSAVDLDGSNRVVNGIVDMGAYESPWSRVDIFMTSMQEGTAVFLVTNFPPSVTGQYQWVEGDATVRQDWTSLTNASLTLLNVTNNSTNTLTLCVLDGTNRDFITDISWIQYSDLNCSLLFGEIPPMPWSGSTGTVIATTTLSVQNMAGWDHFYLSSGLEGSGWISTGILARISVNGDVHEYDLPANDSLDITERIPSDSNSVTISLISTSTNAVSMNQSMNLLKWRPKVSISIQSPDPDCVVIASGQNRLVDLSLASSPPHSGSFTNYASVGCNNGELSGSSAEFSPSTPSLTLTGGEPGGGTLCVGNWHGLVWEAQYTVFGVSISLPDNTTYASCPAAPDPSFPVTVSLKPEGLSGELTFQSVVMGNRGSGDHVFSIDEDTTAVTASWMIDDQTAGATAEPTFYGCGSIISSLALSPGNIVYGSASVSVDIVPTVNVTHQPVMNWTITPSGSVSPASSAETTLQVSGLTRSGSYFLEVTGPEPCTTWPPVTLTVPRVTAYNSISHGRLDPIEGAASTNSAITEPGGRSVNWSLVGDSMGCTIDAASGVVTFRNYQAYSDYTRKHPGKSQLRCRAWDTAFYPNIYDDVTIEVGCNCNCASVPGDPACSINSLHAQFELGLTSDGYKAGDLRIDAEGPSPALGTVDSLDVNLFTIQDMQVVYVSNTLRQVKAPQSFVDITTNGNSYTLDFYSNPDVFTNYDAAGAYDVPQEASPSASWTVTLATPTTLVISGAGGITNEFVYVSGGSGAGWVLSEVGGLRRTSRLEASVGSTNVVTYEVLDNAGVVQSRSVNYEVSGVLAEVVEDPTGSDPLHTLTTYTGGRIQSVTHPDGGTEVFTYATNGQIASVVSTGATVQATLNDYELHEGETLGLQPLLPRTVTETVDGHTVSKTFYAYATNVSGGEVAVVERAATPSAAYGDADNLRTITTSTPATNGSPATVMVEQADGRLDTTITEYGVWDGAVFTVGTGNWMRVTSIEGTTNHPGGIPFKTTQRVEISNNARQNVRSETWVCTGESEEDRALIRCTTRSFDSQGHETASWNSDGTITESSWDCCGKDWEQDAAGIEHTYQHDELKRLDATTKVAGNPIDAVYALDAAGRTLVSTRLAGGLVQATSNAYDLAGRMTQTVDAAGLTTTYASSDGGRISIVVGPGNATNITENYPGGRTKSITGNAVVPQYYVYGAGDDGSQWTRVFTGPAGTNSPVWSQTTVDMLGRTLREERPGFGGSVLTNTYTYNAQSRLIKMTSPGLADTLYEYDDMGNQVRSGLDIDNDGTLDLDENDRVNETETYYAEDAFNDWWQVSVSKVYATADSPVPTTNSIQRTRLTGLGAAVSGGSLAAATVSADVLGNETVSQTIIDRDTKTVTQVVTYPDSTESAESVTVNGLTVSSKTRTGLEYTYTYDALERQTGSTDPRTGTSTTHYNDKGQVDWTHDPVTNYTWFGYDPDTGRQIATTNSLGDAVYSQFDPKGNALGTWGAAYPVLYDFDEFNRMVAMYTLRTNLTASDYSGFRSEVSAFDKTQWLYDEATGLLTNKVYADNKGPRYEYTPDGRLSARIWARPKPGTTNDELRTDYRYDSCCGVMTNIDYSDATPDVFFTFNRLGQQATVTDGTGTRTFTYNDAMQLATETNVAGVIERSYDTLGRSTGFHVGPPLVGAPYSVAYAYDTHGRFGSVSSSVFSVTSVVQYSYLQDSDLISGWSNGTVAVVRTYEANRDLVTQVRNLAGTNVVSQFDYQNDALGRRTERIDSGVAAATNQFGYNSRSELTNALMGAQSFAWALDNIGNRQTYTTNGVTFAYTANALNQYTARTNGGLKTFTHDRDGNLVTDGTWSNTWNAENRMIGVEPVTASNGSKRVELAYDYMGRLFKEVISTFNGSSWETTQTNVWTYESWLPVQEVILAAGGPSTNWWTHGLDLSGSVQGAGGIGGFLSWSRSTDAKTFQYFGDGNGNVTELVDAANPTNIVASYQWDAYGDPISVSGPEAENNVIRWSSKSVIVQTGDKYYGYRILRDHRWAGRDPIDEKGGTHLYLFARNSPVLLADIDGRSVIGGAIVGPGLPSGGQNAPSIPPGGAGPASQSCGKADVTASLSVLLTTIASDYGKWTRCQKASHCQALRNPWTALNGWDIETLKGVGFGSWPFANSVPEGTAGTCARTVVLGGNCYHGGAVNYVLWGKANALCHSTFPMSFDPTYSLAASKATVFAWKTVYLWAQASEAMSFTDYGYHGGSLPSCSLGTCNTSGAVASRVGGYWWNHLW